MEDVKIPLLQRQFHQAATLHVAPRDADAGLGDVVDVTGFVHRFAVTPDPLGLSVSPHIVGKPFRELRPGSEKRRDFKQLPQVAGSLAGYSEASITARTSSKSSLGACSMNLMRRDR